MSEIVIRNAQEDLLTIQQADALLAEVNRISEVSPSLTEAVKAAQYWAAVANKLLATERLNELDVYMAYQSAMGWPKSI